MRSPAKRDGAADELAAEVSRQVIDALAPVLAQASAAPERFVTMADAAAALGCSLSTVKRMVTAGRLPARRLGRGVRVPVSALRAGGGR